MHQNVMINMFCVSFAVYLSWVVHTCIQFYFKLIFNCEEFKLSCPFKVLKYTVPDVVGIDGSNLPAIPLILGFPTNTLPVLPSCVERRPTQLPIQLYLSINYSFSIGNQIILLCFENFLSTWSVKILISAKDTLVLLSLLTVTAIFYNCREGNTCVQTLITNV